MSSGWLWFLLLGCASQLCHGHATTNKTNHSRLEHLLVQDSKLLRHPVTRVYGGQPIQAGNYPYAHVSLLYRGIQHQCGGTIVAQDIIMTAAHCQGWFDTVRFHRTNGDGTMTHEDVAYTEIRAHPDFDPDTFDSDIMFLQLAKPLTDATFIKMNNGAYGPYSWQNLEVVGWGLVDQEGKGDVFPGQLHYANVTFIRNQICEETTYEGKQLYTGEILPSMLCAGGDGRDACSGDSGSPLVRRTTGGIDILVGIVSWGRGCAIYPGVYTRVSYFFEWARQHICWSSIDPPQYLQCKQSERSPQSVARSFLMTSLVPSISPSTELRPSPSPSISIRPSNKFVPAWDSATVWGKDGTSSAARRELSVLTLCLGAIGTLCWEFLA